MTTSIEIFPSAVLNFPVQDGPLATFARNVHDAMLNAPALQNSVPTLAAFLADIDAYDAAIQKAKGKGKGTATARIAKRKKVKTDLHHLRDFIQAVAEQAPSPVEAALLITSVFLGIKKLGKANKAELAAKNGTVAGVVLLVAKAVAKTATYFWQVSTDQKNWVSVPETMKAKTTISGLTSAQTYYFRFRAIFPKGSKDWSQIVSLLVH